MHLPPSSTYLGSGTVLAALLALALGGCAATQVQAPPMPQAAAFKESGEWQRAALTMPVPDAWWTLFHDPVLDELEQRLLLGNESLKVSAAALASARAVFEASRSAFWPTLSAGLTDTRSATPEATTPTAARNPSNAVALSASASWEVDLWGRLAQASSGAQSALQASADDLAAARLSAQALLAQSYFSLRTAEAQSALLQRSVQAYQRSLELTQTRYDGGVAARTDVLQAQTQLSSTQAQLADLEAQRAQAEHALAVLLGVAPSALTLERATSLPTSPEVPQLLSSTLLQRRPDIAAAQHRVAAAWAQIGVADAAYFPALNLSASAGYRNTSLSQLLSAPDLFWSLGPTLAQAIFDGGARQQASAQARASAEQASANYRQAVLSALQEVEDNLVLAKQLQSEVQFQAQALQAAQRNLEITLDQYRAGTMSYLNVVSAQTAALGSESSWLGVRNRQLAALNQLLKNVAGRWDVVVLK